MSKEVQVIVKAVRRKDPDLRRLARALIRYALSDPKLMGIPRAVKPEQRKRAS